MFLKTSTFASLLVVCSVMATSSNAQLVKHLGRLPFVGKVKQASFMGGCDGCTAEPGCGLAGGCDDPSCGCAAPSCGLAGRLLGNCLSAGPGGCGAPIEPSCGSHGLGYGGGFGLCAGNCDSCGKGGYMGRNLMKVNPCACGGSLIGDMARGFILLVDRAVGTTVASFFGGLQKVTCHASGTLAAVQCAAAAACDTCGTVGCDSGCCGAGPSCGLADSGYGCIDASCGAPSCGSPTALATPMEYAPAYSETPSYGSSVHTAPAMAPPVEGSYSQPAAPSAMPVMDAVPIPQSAPTPAVADPFLDDAPVPQARRVQPGGVQMAGYRNYDGPPAPPSSRGQVATASKSSVHRTSHRVVTPSKTGNRYIQAQSQGRPITLRR